MNEQPFTPPLIPPVPQFTQPPGAPLGDDPAERAPISGLAGAIESILRQPRRVMFQLRQPGAGNLIAALVVIAVVCSLVYGLVVGTFSRGDQLWAAPVKVLTGLLLTAAICLPSLYIFACLSGAQARLVEVIGLMAGLLALTTVLLIGFAPVAWVFSESTESVVAMGALHLAFGLIATGFGLRFLGSAFKQLKARSSGGFLVWIIIFVVVLLQMTTALRPIVGKADTFLQKEKMFFVTYWEQCLK
jgi:hypothetical protein